MQAFQQRLRALLLGDDQSIARTYLRFLIEGIEIRDTDVTVLARREAAVRMMSGQEPAAAEVLINHPRRVLPLRYVLAPQG